MTATALCQSSAGCGVCLLARSFPFPLRFHWLPRHTLTAVGLTCTDTNHAPAEACPKFMKFQRYCENLTQVTDVALEFKIELCRFFLGCRTVIIRCLSWRRSYWTNHLTCLGCCRQALPSHFSIVSITARSLDFDYLYPSSDLKNVSFQPLLHLNSFGGCPLWSRLFLQSRSGWSNFKFEVINLSFLKQRRLFLSPRGLTRPKLSLSGALITNFLTVVRKVHRVLVTHSVTAPALMDSSMMIFDLPWSQIQHTGALEVTAVSRATAI